MFTLAIPCLTSSNLPWFMDLTFQVPMQYCPLQHQTLLLSPVTSTTGCCFCFGSNSSFFLELVLHWSPVSYWAPTPRGVHLSVSYLFAFSYCSWGSQGKNTEVFCHSLLQWTTFCQTSPPWLTIVPCAIRYEIGFWSLSDLFCFQFIHLGCNSSGVLTDSLGNLPGLPPLKVYNLQFLSSLHYEAAK